MHQRACIARSNPTFKFRIGSSIDLEKAESRKMVLLTIQCSPKFAERLHRLSHLHEPRGTAWKRRCCSVPTEDDGISKLQAAALATTSSDSSKMVEPFIIGVAGGSASGKKTVCTYITDQLSHKHPKLNRRMATISLTDFYRPLTPEEKEEADRFEWNFDHPDAFDWKLLEAFLADVQAGRPTQVPKFDYIKKERSGFEPFPPTDIILLEGILVLYKRRIRDAMSMRVFVEVDSDTRLSATVTRDTLGTKGRQVKSLETVLTQWMRFVKPAFEDFIMPTKKFADVILPRGADNTVALDILVQHLDDLLCKLADDQQFAAAAAAITDQAPDSLASSTHFPASAGGLSASPTKSVSSVSRFAVASAVASLALELDLQESPKRSPPAAAGLAAPAGLTISTESLTDEGSSASNSAMPSPTKSPHAATSPLRDTSCEASQTWAPVPN